MKSVEITVLGAGSSLIGGTLKTEITREEALELTLDGFLPFCGLDDKPKEEKRSLFRELGLAVCLRSRRYAPPCRISEQQ